MISRQIFRILTTILVVLTVTATVVNAFQALLAALGDVVAAQVTRWVGVGCVILLVVDVILLVGALGLNAMQSSEHSSHDG